MLPSKWFQCKSLKLSLWSPPQDQANTVSMTVPHVQLINPENQIVEVSVATCETSSTLLCTSTHPAPTERRCFAWHSCYHVNLRLCVCVCARAAWWNDGTGQWWRGGTKSGGNGTLFVHETPHCRCAGPQVYTRYTTTDVTSLFAFLLVHTHTCTQFISREQERFLMFLFSSIIIFFFLT